MPHARFSLGLLYPACHTGPTRSEDVAAPVHIGPRGAGARHRLLRSIKRRDGASKLQGPVAGTCGTVIVGPSSPLADSPVRAPTGLAQQVSLTTSRPSFGVIIVSHCASSTTDIDYCSSAKWWHISHDGLRLSQAQGSGASFGDGLKPQGGGCLVGRLLCNGATPQVSRSCRPRS